MTDWKWAMLLILPLMWGGTKPRTWLAVMGASLLAWLPFVPPMSSEWYVGIDLAMGALVMARPSGACSQRTVAMLFVLMAIMDVSWLISPRHDGGRTYYDGLALLGWLQFAVLTLWGIHDTGETVARWLGRRRHSLAAGAGA